MPAFLHCSMCFPSPTLPHLSATSFQSWSWRFLRLPTWSHSLRSRLDNCKTALLMSTKLLLEGRPGWEEPIHLFKLIWKVLNQFKTGLISFNMVMSLFTCTSISLIWTNQTRFMVGSIQSGFPKTLNHAHPCYQWYIFLLVKFWLCCIQISLFFPSSM